jgi:hypothetical protein
MKMAYRLCVLFGAITKDTKSAFWAKVFYAVPWLMFKLEAKRLMIKK